MSQSENAGCAKRCWKVPDTYCKVSINEDLCAECDVCQRQTAGWEYCMRPEPGA